MQIEIPDEIAAAAAEIATATGQPLGSLVTEMVTEAMKMRRVPGIVFADGQTGRRARIEGTGLEVFEVVQGYIAAEHNRDDLRQAFHWLSERQIASALDYYRQFPDDVEPFLFHSDEEFIAFVEASRSKRPPMEHATR